MNWVPHKAINTENVEKYLQKTVETGHFTNYGPNVQLLESEVKKRFEIDDDKAVIVVSNGSIAIQLLANAIDIVEKMDMQWATQSFTFPPSVQGYLRNAKITTMILKEASI